MGALEAFHALGDGGIFQTRGKISWQYLIYGKPYAIFMATAYVLINCELGSEEPIIKQLKSLDGVEVRAYDILAKIVNSVQFPGSLEL